MLLHFIIIIFLIDSHQFQMSLKNLSNSALPSISTVQAEQMAIPTALHVLLTCEMETAGQEKIRYWAFLLTLWGEWHFAGSQAISAGHVCCCLYLNWRWSGGRTWKLSWCSRQQEDESLWSRQMMIESHIFNLVLKDTSISTRYQWAHSAPWQNNQLLQRFYTEKWDCISRNGWY